MEFLIFRDLLIIIIICAFFVMLGVLYFYKSRPLHRKTYPEGHWTGIGMILGICIGMPMGMAAGMAAGDIGIGILTFPVIGAGLGLVFGGYLENKFKLYTRPLTKQEKHMRAFATKASIALLLLGITAFLVFMLIP